jgi:hypothetical protein
MEALFLVEQEEAAGLMRVVEPTANCAGSPNLKARRGRAAPRAGRRPPASAVPSDHHPTRPSALEIRGVSENQA